MQIPLKVTTEYTLLSSLIKLDDLVSTLKENNVTFTFIPTGMKPICELLDIG